MGYSPHSSLSTVHCNILFIIIIHSILLSHICSAPLNSYKAFSFRACKCLLRHFNKTVACIECHEYSDHCVRLWCDLKSCTICIFISLEAYNIIRIFFHNRKPVFNELVCLLLVKSKLRKDSFQKFLSLITSYAKALIKAEVCIKLSFPEKVIVGLAIKMDVTVSICKYIPTCWRASDSCSTAVPRTGCRWSGRKLQSCSACWQCNGG